MSHTHTPTTPSPSLFSLNPKPINTHQLAKKTLDMTTCTNMVNMSMERERVTRRALSAGGRRHRLKRAYLSDLRGRMVGWGGGVEFGTGGQGRRGLGVCDLTRQRRAKAGRCSPVVDHQGDGGHEEARGQDAGPKDGDEHGLFGLWVVGCGSVDETGETKRAVGRTAQRRPQTARPRHQFFSSIPTPHTLLSSV